MATRRSGAGGGIHVGGSISTNGGDVVGGDKTVSAGNGGVAIGGSVADSTIVVGNQNVVQNREGAGLNELLALLDQMRQLTGEAGLEEHKARVIEADVEAVKGEAKVEKPDKSFLLSRLEGINKLLKAAGTLTDSGKKLIPMIEQATKWANGLFP